MGEYAKAGSVRMYYEEHGEGEPLLLLHPGSAPIESLAGLTPELAKHYQVILPEQRGHGWTADVDGPITYNLMAKDTITFMEALDIADAHLIGYSDGAIVGMLVAISRPNLVKKFVNISGNFDVDGLTEEGRATLAALTPEVYGSHPALSQLLAIYNQVSPDGPEHFPVFLAKLGQMWKEEPKIPCQDLSRIKAATLIVIGDRDIITLEHAVEMYRAIPSAQLCILPGASHTLVFDNPAPVIQTMLAFLAD